MNFIDAFAMFEDAGGAASSTDLFVPPPTSEPPLASPPRVYTPPPPPPDGHAGPWPPEPPAGVVGEWYYGASGTCCIFRVAIGEALSSVFIPGRDG